MLDILLPRPAPTTRLVFLFLLLSFFFFFSSSLAQLTNNAITPATTPTPLTTPTPATNLSHSVSARPPTSTGTLHATQSSPTTLVPTTASTSTSSAPAAAATTATSSPMPTLNDQDRLVLHTHLTAPFGILGALLILSGTPMAFWGGRNRWSSYFLTGAYVAAIVVMVPILRFGVIDQDPHPTNVVQGMFILACVVAALAAGGVSVIFWKGTRYLVGAAGGFVLSLFILSLRNNVLIRPPGLRWIVIIATTTIGFVFATIPQISLYVTVVSTAIMGSAAVMIGVDCFTSGGLKEYWIYILGFGQIFPALNGYFPLTITMQVAHSKTFAHYLLAELGVMAGLCLMGAAVQWRLLEVIHQKVRILRQMDRERAMVEEAAAYRQSMALDADLSTWEKRYGPDADGDESTAFAPSPRPHLHNRKSSQLSLIPNTTPPPAAFSPRPRPFLPGIESGTGIAASMGMADGLRSPQPSDGLLSSNSLASPRSPVFIQEQPQLVTQQREALEEIEAKMRTLEEVRQMRVSVEKLRFELSNSSPPAIADSTPSKPSNPTWSEAPRTSPNAPVVFNENQTNTSGPAPILRPRQSMPIDGLRRQSLATGSPIDYERYGAERRVGRPPGAPMNWTKRMTMVDLRDPADASGRPLPLEDLDRLRGMTQVGPSRLITAGEPQKRPDPVKRRSRVMTIEELDIRHKEAIKRLQGPTTERMARAITDTKTGSGQRPRRPSNQMPHDGNRSTSFEERKHQRTASYAAVYDDPRNGLTSPPIASTRFPSTSSPFAPGVLTTPGATKKDKASWLDY
ncbi:hypothetical protein CROQUDRAFT_133108 [Cronartium quercuum f. sp. fusiforme G11]|uniref:TM7S3/TM198-like domain-containing protein n=1 Tax=Cronartium quercuum f. sp. fusiforme G11 TaxID=708437 RepID=A0A9P6TCB5_9BASI|nr:hypothetical protein CROQUDRAFT_133108 [Cronartium quercuum f. sp. fusiforme G11]